MDLTQHVINLVKRPMAAAAKWREEGTRGPHAMSASAQSPEQFELFTSVLLGRKGGTEARPPLPNGFAERAKFLLQVAPNMVRSMLGIIRSARTLRRNPENPRRHITPAELAEVERHAHAHGADLIGYARLNPDHIFAGRRVLDGNVICLAMEMAKQDMAKAPHFDTESEVHRVYADLGDVAFEIANLLRKRGFAAEAGPALGGDSIYPAIAQAAGIGWVGRNGLLLTEAFGPRVRLAVVYCSVDNLPFHDASDTRLQWLREFCDMCGACIRRCPPQALKKRADLRANGAPTHVDSGTCHTFFQANYGCGVCIKVCPLSHVDVARIRRAYERRHHSEEHAERLEQIVTAPERLAKR